MKYLKSLIHNFCGSQKNFKRSLLLSGLLLYANSAFAIINGKPANESLYDAVGALTIEAEGTVLCTATLIAPNWIVTADHCIQATTGSEEEGMGEPLPAEHYEFRLGKDFNKAPYRVKLKRWVSGPFVNGETVDIAFGELSNPIAMRDLRLNTIPPLTQEWNADDLLKPYLHIGYGTAKAFSTEPHWLFEKRQLARFKVTSSSGNALLNIFGSSDNLARYITQFHPEMFEAGEMDSFLANAEMLPRYSVHAWDERGRTDLTNVKVPRDGWQDTCFGDSGGPLLRELDGQLRIVGVVSQGMDRICSPLGTRFTVFGPKVRELMKQLGITAR